MQRQACQRGPRAPAGRSCNTAADKGISSMNEAPRPPGRASAHKAEPIPVQLRSLSNSPVSGVCLPACPARGRESVCKARAAWRTRTLRRPRPWRTLRTTSSRAPRRSARRTLTTKHCRVRRPPRAAGVAAEQAPPRVCSGKVWDAAVGREIVSEGRRAELRSRDHSLCSAPDSRPATLDDVAHQDEVVKTLKRTLDSANVAGATAARAPRAPHRAARAAATSSLLRPARHGQDVRRACNGAAAVWVRERAQGGAGDEALLTPRRRPELFRKRVLELNASNERGIDVIRACLRCVPAVRSMAAGG
jgi:hypothetical protein